MVYDGRLVGPQDDDLLLADSVTKTASANLDSVDLGEGFAPAPAAPISVQGNVSALDAADGDETYQIKVQQSSDDANWEDAGLSWTVTATGTFYKIVGITKRYVRLVLTLAGTSPSITLDAWLNRA